MLDFAMGPDRTRRRRVIAADRGLDKDIFAAPELTRHSESAKMAVFSEGYGRNDLQVVVAARFPEVAACVAALSCAAPAEMPEKRLDLLLAR